MDITRKSFLRGLAGAGMGIGLFHAMTPGLSAAQSESGSVRRRRIARIEFLPFALGSKQAISTTLGRITGEEVLVRIRTEGGLVGWGEASPRAPITGEMSASAVAVGKGLAPVVLNRDPFDLARIVADMDTLTVGNPSIKAAIEMALWDICGKLAGQPVCHLLGQYRDSFETDRTVYLDEPKAMAQKAREIIRAGYRIIKVKVGQTPESDVARLSAIRAAVGEKIGIRIDANQGWTREAAVYALRRMEEFNVEFCEQPVAHWDWDGLRYVHERSRIPIMADESIHEPSDVIECVRRSAANLINVKLMKSGGILKAVQTAEIADAANIQCMFGCMAETRIALTAAAHVVAAKKCVIYADLDSFTEHKTDPVIGGMQVKDGIVSVSETPGLGLDLDPAFLKTLQPA